VLRDDTEQTLAARVLREEHRIYVQAIRWLCKDKVILNEQGHTILRHRKQPGFALVSPGLE
jgi:phosphoribosylglycinamide formyltransferase-1